MQSLLIITIIGYIDSWGTCTLKIINSCRKAKLLDPSIEERDGGILLTIFKNQFPEGGLKTEKSGQKGGIKVEYTTPTLLDHRFDFLR